MKELHALRNRKGTAIAIAIGLSVFLNSFFSGFAGGSLSVKAEELDSITIKVEEQRPKRVYADYHGPRYTRDIDGATGQWSYTGTASKSTATQTSFNYNADIIGDDGRNQIASVSYPAIGMNSQSDPDYIEYQILLAKAAHIDGFFVEWGFQEHSSNQQLKLMQQIAEKYNFEIGVNWCDAWLYDWISTYRPDVITREDKVNAFKGELQYLMENVFNRKTGPTYNGHPIIYMFGGGATPQEFSDIKAADYRIPDGLEVPWFFRRAPMDGKLDADGNVNYQYNTTDWHKASGAEALTDGPFGWIPPRTRIAAKDGYSAWDKYATTEDNIKFLEVLKQSFIDNRDSIKLRNSVVTPGMDNRGSAGWGTDLSFIPRNEGQTYSKMWQFNVENREDVDIVYIASWNDYTEGHQIEPTLEEGDREIHTTQKFAAQFKGEVQNSEEGLRLPAKLFELRKRHQFLVNSGLFIGLLSSMNEKLNQAAMYISRSDYDEASLILTEVEEVCNEADARISKAKINFKPELEGIRIEAPLRENVAFNKSVTASVNNEEARKVVDGLDTDESTWNAEGQYIYWVEFDLQDIYNLIGGEISSGTKEGTDVVKNVRMQYLEENLWKYTPETIAVNNTKSNLNFEFINSITTQKVRVLFKDVKDAIKIREIKLFANRFPEVNIITPSDGLTMLPNLALELKAKAADRDGKVERVEFYVDGVLATDSLRKTEEPDEYLATLKGLGLGTHQIQAKAFDNEGAVTVSKAVQVKVDIPLINIALNKPIIASSEMTDSPAKYAVDGEISDDLRWRTNTKDAVHWLEIDLQGEATIQGAEFITGYSNGGWAVKNMKLQAWNGMEWIDIPGIKTTNNTKTQVNLIAQEPVTTNKVRFYSDDGTRGLRIREIKVFAYDKLPSDESVETEVLSKGESVTHLEELSAMPDTSINNSEAVDSEYDIINGLYIAIDERHAGVLRNNYYEGYVTFEYLDKGTGSFRIFTDTIKSPTREGDYSIVANINKGNTGKWIRAKVRIYAKNTALLHKAENNSDFIFKGDAKIRNISFDFNIFKVVNYPPVEIIPTDMTGSFKITNN